MADQTDEQRRYNSSVLDNAAEDAAADAAKTVDKIPAHEGSQKTTRSTEGSAETTTTEKK